MADLPELSLWSGVYQIETTDPVVGGVNGVSNAAPKALTNRTRWLRDQLDALAAALGALGTAAARNVGLGAADLPSTADADGRYARLTATNVLTGNWLRIEGATPNLRLAETDSPLAGSYYYFTQSNDRAEQHFFDGTAGRLVTRRRVAAGGALDHQFHVGAALAGLIEGPGVGVTSTQTLVTIEKGDGRYVQRSDADGLYAPLDHVGAAGAAHPAATAGAAGFMSAADKAKLDGVAPGAQANVPTNLGVGGAADARTITSSTGAAAPLPLATGAAAGLMRAADKAKLDAVRIERYVSPDIDLVPGGLVTLAHGLGVAPWALHYRLKCVTADGGYAPGDVLDPTLGAQSEWTSTGSLYLGAAVTADAAAIRIRFGDNPAVFWVIDPDDGSAHIITPSRWRLVVRAEP